MRGKTNNLANNLNIPFAFPSKHGSIEDAMRLGACSLTSWGREEEKAKE